MGDLGSIYDRLEAQSVRPDDFACAACEDLGWRPTDDGAVARCSCRMRPAARDVLARLAPERYRACTLETWRGEVPAVASDWLKDPQGMLYVYGRQGRGKTHLATAIFAELVVGGLSGEWRDALALVNFCRRNLESESREMGRLERAGLVLLDDVHLARTDYAREELDGLIRARDLACRPMIITSNASLRDLVGERDPAVLSRIRGHEVELVGPDWRGGGIDTRRASV